MSILMGTLDLSDLPSRARYESSCYVRTSEDTRPKWFWPTAAFGRGRDLTIYLTSRGEVCPYYSGASHAITPASIFNLKDVAEVSYNEKSIKSGFKNKFLYETSTLFFVFILGMLFFGGISIFAIYDTIINYELVSNPNIIAIEGSSNSVEIVQNTFSNLIFAVLLCLLISIFAFIFSIIPRFILKNLPTWSEQERIDFVFNNEEKISFYGNFPYENRFYFCWGMSIVFWISLIPSFVHIDFLLLQLVWLSFLILCFTIYRFSKSILTDFDADENRGKVKVSGLNNFYNAISDLNLSTDEKSARDSSAFHFEYLVDRLSSEVSGLVGRLEVHERALAEITEKKWVYTHQVAEVDQGLTQIRKCAERVLYQRVENFGISTGARTDLNNLKSILVKNNLISEPEPLSNIDVILSKGGSGSHATKGYADNDDDYVMALRALVNLIEWHFDNPIQSSTTSVFDDK